MTILRVVLALAVGLISASAFAQTTGTVVSRLSTLPRGAALLPDLNGGHWWVSDQALGICQLVPQNLPGQPPFLLNFCTNAVKTGGQIVVGNPAPSLGLIAGSKFVYVADASSSGITVVRFVFAPNGNSGNGSFTGNTQLKVQNATVVAGGGGGGGGGGAAGGAAGGGAGGTGRTGGAMFVFVKKDGKYSPRVVRVGVSDFDYTEVLSGVQEGEQVALLGPAVLQAQRNQLQARVRAGTGGGLQQPTTPAAGAAAGGGGRGGGGR
jgi:hypothetical protein